MTYAYILLATAQDEYESSITWYAERSLTAANQFIEAVEHTLQLICEHPDRWRNEYKKYYELGLNKYPFSIVYTIEAENRLVVVRSIYHHSRNPKKKYKK
jgi:plasmid stabilization system protein ParE